MSRKRKSNVRNDAKDILVAGESQLRLWHHYGLLTSGFDLSSRWLLTFYDKIITHPDGPMVASRVPGYQPVRKLHLGTTSR